MLARFLIWSLLLLVVWRALRSLFAGIVQGASAPPPPPAAPPEKGELMVRDPVCGTFVLPSRSVSAQRPERHPSLLLRPLPAGLSAAVMP